MIAKRGLDFLKRSKSKLEEWQERNPSRPFKDFFAESVESKLRSGKPHDSLGGNLSGKEYGTSGKGYFRRLTNLGLKPDDTCVDYGCGTLRLGIHAINYLKPGAYWGMDISEFLLEEGRKLIGDRLWTEKQPHLRVISVDSVAEAAAAEPDMLISVKVLIHVHPDELPEYFQNIMKIIGASGQAIITGKWSDTATIQYSKRSWAHAASRVIDLVSAEGGSVEILKEEECELEGVGQTAKSGMFRIAHGTPRR